VRRGKIPAYRIDGLDKRTDTNATRRQKLRFRKADLDAFLESRRVRVALAEQDQPSARSHSSSAAAPAA